jgi:Flp pilus assembly protein TadD
MQPIEPPDTFRLSAAQGWLELGDAAEARLELDQISPGTQSHPRVLQVRWILHATQRDWPAALEVARALLKVAPESPEAWLHHAYALRRIPEGGLQQAWDALMPALEKFPGEETVAYNLACYACQMNQLDTARSLLRRALAAGGNREQMKQMALHDEDLQPLWTEIRGL